MIDTDTDVQRSRAAIPLLQAPGFNAAAVLETLADATEILKLRKGTRLYSQGIAADAIYFVESGSVKVTIGSVKDREAVLSRRGPGEFFGEKCLLGHALRVCTATTIEPSTVLKVPKQSMIEAFRSSPRVYENFIASLVVSNVAEESMACHKLFSYPEQRLARVLLKLNRYDGHHLLRDSRISQANLESLGSLVGVSPSRVLRFLNQFRKLGLIHDDPNGGIAVRSEMLADMVLAAKPPAPAIDQFPPRAHPKERPTEALLTTVRQSERHWKETACPGISTCELFENASEGQGAILVKMEPGARYPDHQHMAREQFYIIDGDVRVGPLTLRAGDYHRAEASTYHRQVSTKEGCMCIMLGDVSSISAKVRTRVTDTLLQAPPR